MKYETYNFRRIDKHQLIDNTYYRMIVDSVTQIKARNIATYNKAIAEWEQMLALAKSTFGVNHREYKHIRRIKIEMPPTFKADLKRLENWRNEAFRLAKQREYSREYRARSAGAKGDLLAAGFEEWAEFNPMRAITERSRLMEQVDGIWIKRLPLEQTEL